MKEKIRPILFFGLLISMSIVNIISPKMVFSSKENRYLQEFPKLSYKTLISGDFQSNFEKYTTDQFIGRDSWISLKTITDLALLKKDNTRVYFGKEDYLFDVDNGIDEEQFSKNIKNVNLFINSIKNYNKDILITTLLVPTKTEVFPDKLPLYAPVVNEREIVEKIKTSLEDNVNILDLIDILKKKSNENIYYKTDHHWTTKGAFYGYEYYLNEMGLSPLDESEFLKEKVSDSFYGTSYRKANFYLGKPDEIYSYKPKEEIKYDITYNNTINTNNLYDESFLNKTDKYSYFFGGDKALTEIETSIKNDKSILIIKDSFANSLIPFLLNHYENIFVIDTRYFNMSINDYIKENDVDELLFLYNIQNFVQEKSFSKFGI